MQHLKKKRTIIILVFIIVICIGGYKLVNYNSNPLSKINTYRVYYGSINQSIIREMNKLDMIILEPLQIKTDQIMKNEKTMVFGYLSVIEIAKWDEELISKIHKGDYLYLDGEEIVNKNYGNKLGDISQSHFRQVLLEIIEKRIINKGLNGVFLDTVDWIDYYQSHDQKVYKKLKQGYEQLLVSIKQRYPHLKIIQNRGFDPFNTVTNKYVDGLLWENFDIENKDTLSKLNEVKRTAEANNVTIFLILKSNNSKNIEFSKKNKWPAIYKEHSYSIW